MMSRDSIHILVGNANGNEKTGNKIWDFKVKFLAHPDAGPRRLPFHISKPAQSCFHQCGGTSCHPGIRSDVQGAPPNETMKSGP
jgi:hypothetical protein